MEEQRFDELVRALARSTSRRRVLKALGASMVGGALAGIGSSAAAQGNSDAAKFCASVFPPGPERGKCVSDAAHGTGIYYECGPGAPAGSTQQVCGTVCVDTATDTGNCGACGNSCPGGQPCVNGQCGCPQYYAYCPQTESCVIDNCAFNYRVEFDPATCGCVCQSQYIALPGGGCGIQCATDADCPYGTCATTEEELKVCADNAVFSENPTCTTSEQCYADFNHGINSFCVDGWCRGAI